MAGRSTGTQFDLNLRASKACRAQMQSVSLLSICQMIIASLRAVATAAILLPAARGDPLLEGAKSSWRSHSRPCRLDQHPTRRAAALVRDAPGIGWPLTGLPHARIESLTATSFRGFLSWVSSFLASSSS